MKKYLRYVCSVCNRTTDKLVDNVRFSPDKCTITLKCAGRLLPLEYRSDGGITSAPRIGLLDWRPRGSTQVSLRPLETDVLINTSTGTQQQIVLALKSIFSVPMPAGSTARLTLNKRSTAPVAFRQYVFRQEGSFTTISGVESGLERKTLRFVPSDSIEVFLNGVKQEQGSAIDQYQIYDGVNEVPPNTISFNSQVALPGIIQVDIIVSPPSQVEQLDIDFTRNEFDESRVGTGAWENIDSIELFENGNWVSYYLFTCDLVDASQLQLNTLMSTNAPIEVIGYESVAISDAKLLLAAAPFTQLDRYLSALVSLETTSLDRDYFKYSLVEKTPTLQITETAVSPVYPTIRVSPFQIETTIRRQVPGTTNQTTIDGLVVVGPDV